VLSKGFAAPDRSRMGAIAQVPYLSLGLRDRLSGSRITALCPLATSGGP